MAIGEIGLTDDTALLCHTNNPPSSDSGASGGDWFGPNGTRVLGCEHDCNSVPGFVRNRHQNVVRLKRSNSTIQPEGVYKCVVQDNTLVIRTVYVKLNGMYNNHRYCTMIIIKMKGAVFTLSILQPLHHSYPLPLMETQLFQLTPSPVELIS